MILHSFVSSKYFDLASSGIIGLNVIMMALEYYLMPWVSIRHSFIYRSAPAGGGAYRGKCV